MDKSIFSSYRAQVSPTPQTPPKGIIAGRIIPVAPAPVEVRRALTALAALVLPLLAVGVVVYAAQSLPPTSAPPPSPAVEVSPAVIERVVEVQEAPVVVVVTATPVPAQVVPPAQVMPTAAPRQVAPPHPATSKPTAPQVQPRPAQPVQRPAQSVPAPTPAGPQERLLGRPCVYPSAPQGTVVRGYYTDANGVKRDAVCRADGWKAID